MGVEKGVRAIEVVDIIGTDFPAVMTIFGDGFLRFLSRSPLTQVFRWTFCRRTKK